MSAGSGHDRRRYRAQHRPRILLGPLAVGAVGPQPPGRPPGVLRRGSRCATTIRRGTASWRPAAHRHRRILDRPLGDQGMTRQRQGAVAALRHQPSRRLHRDHPDIGDVRARRGSADCLHLRLGHLGLLQHPHADRQHALTDTEPVVPHTDEAYRHDPPGIHLLYCVTPARCSGEFVLVDGFSVAARRVWRPHATSRRRSPGPTALPVDSLPDPQALYADS